MIPRPLVIVGPTAGGKSELAWRMAQSLRPMGLAASGEVINADSMQIYRAMDAGTAKPTPAVRERVVHHLIDIVDPGAHFTVAHWLEQAEDVLAHRGRGGVRCVVAGGTNLYLKALLEGMAEMPGRDEDLRAKLETMEAAQLHKSLETLDPISAERIHINDRKRLIRALEVFHLTGQPLSQLQTQWEASSGQDTYRHRAILIGLQWPTELINRRINLRVKAMFEPARVDAALAAEVCFAGESLVDEVRRLLATDAMGPEGSQAREALGYKQVIDALEGRITLDEAMEQTRILTRRLAKQQRTWLRRYREVFWIDATQGDMDHWVRMAVHHILMQEQAV